MSCFVSIKNQIPYLSLYKILLIKQIYIDLNNKQILIKLFYSGDIMNTIYINKMYKIPSKALLSNIKILFIRQPL